MAAEDARAELHALGVRGDHDGGGRRGRLHELVLADRRERSRDASVSAAATRAADVSLIKSVDSATAITITAPLRACTLGAESWPEGRVRGRAEGVRGSGASKRSLTRGRGRGGGVWADHGGAVCAATGQATEVCGALLL